MMATIPLCNLLDNARAAGKVSRVRSSAGVQSAVCPDTPVGVGVRTGAAADHRGVG